VSFRLGGLVRPPFDRRAELAGPIAEGSVRYGAEDSLAFVHVLFVAACVVLAFALWFRFLASNAPTASSRWAGSPTGSDGQAAWRGVRDVPGTVLRWIAGDGKKKCVSEKKRTNFS